MEKQHKNTAWVPHEEIAPEAAGKGCVRRIMAYSEDAMCVENTFETGGVGAMHSHPHTQITYIVSGRFRFTIGEETREVGPGDTLLKKNGVEHGCVCLEAGVMIDFFTPMREDFVSQE
ncbi:MAG: cupin domain-containing protein [Clostridiales bacterium]|nr:cupin domain-containing protein [Clostridiales bacterium]